MSQTRLIINPIGGLANRMRAIASGISLMHALYRHTPQGAIPVELNFIWRKNWELNAEFADIFLMPTILQDRISYPSKLKYDFFYSIPRKKNLYISAITNLRHGLALYSLHDSYHRRFHADTDGKILLATVLNALNKGQSCFLQSGTIFYPFADDTYINLFKPTDEIRRQSDLRVKALGSNKIGLHIRRSDNIESIKYSPDYLFIDKVTDILQRNPATRFYLATDDALIKLKFTRIFGDRIISSDAPAYRNSVDGIKEAAIELFTLAGTDKIFGSYYSSFSEAAAMLGQKPFEQLTI